MGAFDCSGDAKDINASPAGIPCATNPCTASECCTVTPAPARTCANTAADNTNVVFDCASDAKDINASPAGITCGANPCTATECCTVTPAGTCANIAADNTNAVFDCASNAKDINASPAGI